MPGGSSWNPNDKNSAITLSTFNRRAVSNAATQTGVRSTAGRSGRVYFEIALTNFTGNTGLGIATSSWSFTDVNGLGGGTSSMGVGWAGGGVFVNNVQIANFELGAMVPTTACFAIDFANNKLYYRVANGNWNNNATNNPDTDTGGLVMTGLAAGTFFIAFGTSGSTTDDVTMNGGIAAFAQTKPTTFQPWDMIVPFVPGLQASPILCQ